MFASSRDRLTNTLTLTKISFLVASSSFTMFQNLTSFTFCPLLWSKFFSELNCLGKNQIRSLKGMPTNFRHNWVFIAVGMAQEWVNLSFQQTWGCRWVRNTFSSFVPRPWQPVLRPDWASTRGASMKLNVRVQKTTEVHVFFFTLPGCLAWQTNRGDKGAYQHQSRAS